nr:MAG TPA: hypothetical protein [Caudoviricetes sp.]
MLVRRLLVRVGALTVWISTYYILVFLTKKVVSIFAYIKKFSYLCI